ncbi:MAG: hypothetical protein C4297_07845 [Gemmataceae bacterium]
MHRQRAANLVTLVVLVWGLTLEGTADWPRFRGPNGQGISADTGVPIVWDLQRHTLWKVALPGQGNASPIVSGERVFLQAASEDGTQRWLLCYDALTGKELWRRSAGGRRAAMHRKNTLASSTPAADGQRVVCLFWDGQALSLHAFDYAGNKLWEYGLGPFVSQHGAGTSPVLHKGRVYVNCDQDDAARVVAVDAHTGKLLWEKTRPAFRACYSTPVVRGGTQGEELIVASSAGISAYDLLSGQQTWHWEWKFEGMVLRTVSSPVLAQGLIVMTSGDGGGSRHAVAVKPPDGSGSAPRVVWQEQRIFPYVPTLIGHGDYLFFVNDRGVAGCVRAADGKPVWTERLGGNVSASPVLAGDTVIACTEEGDVYCFAAAPAFHLRAHNTLREPIIATPAIHAGRLYIRTRQHLYCLGEPVAAGAPRKADAVRPARR